MGGSVGRLLLRRIAAGIAVLWVISVVLYAATYVLPGDAAMRILGNRCHNGICGLRCAEKMGLNRSLPEQYFAWFTGVIRGDAGTSTTGKPKSGPCCASGAQTR